MDSIITRSVRQVRQRNGILAQLGEHLPYKQRVTGSSPVGPIRNFMFRAAVAELADARDLKSRGGDIVPVRFRSAALNVKTFYN